MKYLVTGHSFIFVDLHACIVMLCVPESQTYDQASRSLRPKALLERAVLQLAASGHRSLGGESVLATFILHTLGSECAVLQPNVGVP